MTENQKIFQQTKDNYQKYFNTFEGKLDNVCEKQYYRIYLKNQADKSLYQKLVNQNNHFHGLIEEQKQKNITSNKHLLQQIEKLEKIKLDYLSMLKKCKKSLSLRISTMHQSQKQNQTIFRQIKTKWQTIKNESQQCNKSVMFPSISQQLHKITCLKTQSKEQNKYENSRYQKTIKYILQEKHKGAIITLFLKYIRRNIDRICLIVPNISLIYQGIQNQSEQKAILLKELEEVINN